MKIRSYIVKIKNPKKEVEKREVYYVDAPNKYVARWCGANLFNDQYFAFLTAKDMTATRYHCK